MLVPETETPLTAPKRIPRGATKTASSEFNTDQVNMPKDANLLGAISRGTTDGLHLALNVAAMLVAFLALIALLNGALGWVHNGLAQIGFRWFPDSLQAILGPIFAPVAFLIGIPWKDCFGVGNLLGTRMVLNELVAFSQLGPMKATLDPRSFTIATFALCGFANLGSIGIQIGGIGALAPNKRDELARLGFRAMLAGTMANLMSASIVGLLLR
jgi:CNT family concentrative nucleoside transporter